MVSMSKRQRTHRDEKCQLKDNERQGIPHTTRQAVAVW